MWCIVALFCTVNLVIGLCACILGSLVGCCSVVACVCTSTIFAVVRLLLRINSLRLSSTHGIRANNK